MKIQEIIHTLKMEKHPEGGYFKETFRSTGRIKKDTLSNQYSGDRNFSTSIYFLLTSDQFSAFHRIIQDETWYHHEGLPIRIHEISSDGMYSFIDLGALSAGYQPQYTVAGGTWFASEVIGQGYGLVGCNVAPGFDFDDFELADRQALRKLSPEKDQIINRLTR